MGVLLPGWAWAAGISEWHPHKEYVGLPRESATSSAPAAKAGASAPRDTTHLWKERWHQREETRKAHTWGDECPDIMFPSQRAAAGPKVFSGFLLPAPFLPVETHL